MGEKKVAIMRLKVDLQCEKCYRKVKRVLCKFPQIQDQVYDEKQNTVTIKVVCCSPEKIKQKICCKGGDSIKSIEIVPPPKPKEPEKPKEPPKPKEPEKPKEPPKPKEPEKPKPPPAPATAPAPAPAPAPERVRTIDPQPGPSIPPTTTPPAPAPAPKPAPAPAPPPAPAPAPAPAPVPAPCFPQHPAPCFPPNPGATCCRECYEGRGGGPCYQLGNYGPPRYYDGYCGRPVYDSWGGGRGGGGYCYKINRCDYFCEENPNAACTIM